ncbi:hypothetical protein RI367_003121 [Sorochytrium milnesiophthora]
MSCYGVDVYIRSSVPRPFAKVQFPVQSSADALIQQGSHTVAQYTLMAWKPDQNVATALKAMESRKAQLITAFGSVQNVMDVWFADQATRDKAVP